MPQMLEVLRIVFGARWLSHGEYAKTLAASCQREEAQRIKQAWRDHIEAAAAVFEDSRSVTDSSSEGCFLESLIEHLDGVFLIATQLWKNQAFVACIKKVLRMKHHVFDIFHRPSSCLMWDRKAWSLQNFFVARGARLDPGNWVLFSMTQVLIHIRNKIGIPLPDDVTEDLARIDVAQEVNPNMKLGAKSLEYAGDILEAIGGICNPWQVTSKAMIKEMKSKDFRLSSNMFDETHDMMGQLARKMKNFMRSVHRLYPENIEYHALQLLVEIISRGDNKQDDASEEDAKNTEKNYEARG